MSTSQTTSTEVLMLGAGNFGTALAHHLGELGHDVTIWTRDERIADGINHSQKNPRYISTVTLSSRVRATRKITEELLANQQFIVVAVPTQAIREVIGAIRPWIRKDAVVVSAAKGIEISTLELPHQILSEMLGPETQDRLAVLSGPSFAIEIAQKQPTAVSVGSRSKACSESVQELFHAAHFRVYTTQDPLGLEIGGAIKNVIAIASGASRGLGFQNNSWAALITRGLAEMARLGVALGCNPLTFNGLGGVGDLFLTCSSEKSRNYLLGFRLGQGMPLAAAIESLGSVAEGVSTAKAAFDLARRIGVDMPIVEEVYRVIYESKPIIKSVSDLLNRDPKSELE